MGKGIVKSIQTKRLRRQVEAALEQGKWEAAKAGAQKLAAAEPESPEAHLLLGLAHMKTQSFSGALACYQRAAKLDPDDAVTWKNLVLAASRSGDAKWAVQGLEALARLEPHDEAHVARLKDLCFRIGRLEKAFQLCQTHGFTTADANAVVRTVNQANRQNKPKVALTLARAMTKLDPKNPKGYALMGATYFRQGDMEHAQACFENALKLDPTNVVAQNNLALVHLRRKQWDKASAVLERLAQTSGADANPEQIANVFSNLAKSYEQQHQLTRARQTYEKMLLVPGAAEQARHKLDSFDMPLAARRGQDAFLAQKRERTADHDDTAPCQQCGAKVERGATFCQNCGAVYGPSRPCTACGSPLPADAKFCSHCGGEQGESDRSCLRCGTANPDPASHCGACGSLLIQAQHLTAKGQAALAQMKQSMALRRVEAALDHCRTMQEAEPESAYPWLGASMVYEAAGRPQQALDACTQAADLAQDDSASISALERLAMLNLFHLNQPGEALHILERAVRRHPQGTHWLYLIGIAHARLGQVDEALQAYRQMAEDPRYALLAQAAASDLLASQGHADAAMGYCCRVLHPLDPDRRAEPDAADGGQRPSR